MSHALKERNSLTGRRGSVSHSSGGFEQHTFNRPKTKIVWVFARNRHTQSRAFESLTTVVISKCLQALTPVCESAFTDITHCIGLSSIFSGNCGDDVLAVRTGGDGIVRVADAADDCCNENHLHEKPNTQDENRRHIPM